MSKEDDNDEASLAYQSLEAWLERLLKRGKALRACTTRGDNHHQVFNCFRRASLLRRGFLHSTVIVAHSAAAVVVLLLRPPSRVRTSSYAREDIARVPLR